MQPLLTLARDTWDDSAAHPAIDRRLAFVVGGITHQACDTVVKPLLSRHAGSEWNLAHDVLQRQPRARGREHEVDADHVAAGLGLLRCARLPESLSRAAQEKPFNRLLLADGRRRTPARALEQFLGTVFQRALLSRPHPRRRRQAGDLDCAAGNGRMRSSATCSRATCRCMVWIDAFNNPDPAKQANYAVETEFYRDDDPAILVARERCTRGESRDAAARSAEATRRRREPEHLRPGARASACAICVRDRLSGGHRAMRSSRRTPTCRPGGGVTRNDRARRAIGGGPECLQYAARRLSRDDGDARPRSRSSAFVIIQLPPGDFLTTLVRRAGAGRRAIDQAHLEALRERYGLDQPIYVQYCKWITGILLHGDFGYLVRVEAAGRRPDLGAARLHAAALGLDAAVRLGARVPDRHLLGGAQVFDRRLLFTFFGFLGLAIPNFLLALVLMYVGFRVLRAERRRPVLARVSQTRPGPGRSSSTCSRISGSRSSSSARPGPPS